MITPMTTTAAAPPMSHAGLIPPERGVAVAGLIGFAAWG
jgi:hypothetical protein